ncbi:WG repeat-containing protein [Kitasatospora sp. A2-31]|uniref:WG repeat-containing protein n=1 Tax=Kitasatospora sp. A2-31 TaxID=2916414 RepID=UPI00272DDB5C|nr:WG repeat-containing protein [Kitasatospora sp. A2-31]
MPSTPPAVPPYAVPCPDPAGSGTRHALVDADGRLVREPDLSAVGPFHADGRGGFVAPAADRDGRWGYLDHRGTWLAEPELRHAGAFEELGLSRFQAADGRWGYAGPDGTPVIPPTLVEAYAFRHGMAVAATEDGWCYIDGTGRVVISGPFSALGAFGPNGLVGVRMADSGLCGYLDRTGRQVIEARFDGASPFGPDGVAPVRMGEDWGLIDESGEWVVEPSYARLDAFAGNGLAYVLGGTPGDRHKGYLNARGELVIKAENRISDTFGAGLVRFDDDYLHGYLDATGAEVIEQRYQWAEDFDEGGAAVAHFFDPGEDGGPEAGASAEARPPGRAWGVLHADGRFLPVDHPEPLTDVDGWILGFSGGLAPFVTGDGGIAYVARDGRDVCRVQPSDDGGVLRIVDRAGATLWETSAAAGTFEGAEIAHARDAAGYLVHPGAPERDVVDLAEELVAAAPRRFERCSPTSGDCEDLFELPGEEDEDVDGTSLGAVRVVAEAYLLAEHQHDLPYLQEWTVERFQEIEADAVERLSARFGAPLPGVEIYLRSGDGETSTVWGVGGRRLVLQSYLVIGDGDVEIQLWLAVVDPEPSGAQAEGDTRAAVDAPAAVDATAQGEA